MYSTLSTIYMHAVFICLSYHLHLHWSADDPLFISYGKISKSLQAPSIGVVGTKIYQIYQCI